MTHYGHVEYFRIFCECITCKWDTLGLVDNVKHFKYFFYTGQMHQMQVDDMIILDVLDDFLSTMEASNTNEMFLLSWTLRMFSYPRWMHHK